MKRSTWIWVAAAVLAAGALLAWAFAPRPVEVEAASVSRGAFETAISEDGKTRLRDRYVVSAPLAGRLARITLREGDAVQAGDVVATLTPVLPQLVDERTLREQRLRVEIAEAQAERIQARAERARVALQQARNDVLRSEQLARDGFIAPTKLEADRLAALAAQKELDAAVQERHVAGHEVEQARAALLAVRAGDARATRRFAVQAPTAGRVLRIVQPSESTVALGAPLLELGDTANLEVVAELLTADALRASPGSRVRIDRWGGEGPLEGRVRRVEPAAFTKVSALGVEEQRVKVLIDITTPRERWEALGDGFRVGVHVVTTALDDAIRVPVGAVFPVAPRDGAAGGMAVFVLAEGRARLTPVQVAARNESHAWVTQGVAPGARVIVYPPATVRDGARVAERAV